MVLFITQLQKISSVYLLKEHWCAFIILERKFRFLENRLW